MQVLEVRNNSVKVLDKNDLILLVAKYTDEGGEYFLNNQLKKQYIKEEEIITLEPEEITEEESEELEVATNYRFTVMYQHKGSLEGWRIKDSVVTAKNRSEALEKINKSFKVIYSIEEY